LRSAHLSIDGWVVYELPIWIGSWCPSVLVLGFDLDSSEVAYCDCETNGN
jgi:hypothetical protein